MVSWSCRKPLGDVGTLFQHQNYLDFLEFKILRHALDLAQYLPY
jgi:hypothetical protein